MSTVIDSSDLERLAQETLRRIAVGEIEGVDVAKAIREGDALEVEDDTTLDFGNVDFADIGGDEVRIIHGEYYRGFLGGDLTYDGYRIGDRWYIRTVDLVGNVDWFDECYDAEAQTRFRSWTQHWIEQQFRPVPTSISGMYRDEPWFIRALAEQAVGREEYTAEEMQSDNSLTGDDNVVRATELWRIAVTTDPDDVPALAGELEDTDEFVAWLAGHDIRWTDGGETLDIESAIRLRMICRFLASV